MSIGISEEHEELAASLRKWAASLGGAEAARTLEDDPDARFHDTWAAVGEMGVPTIALPESAGGGGGSVLDLAVAVEACAYGLVPGPLLGPAVASLVVPADSASAKALAGGARVALGLAPSLVVGENLTGTIEVVWDLPGATHVLVGGTDPAGAEAWFMVPADRVFRRPGSRGATVDLTRRFGSASVDVPVGEVERVDGLDRARLRRAAVALAAAEASGVARWCLETAVEYAGVR